MNWYKKANKENFPVWLAQQLAKETDNFKNIARDTFESRNLQLVEDWINEANPDFENISLNDAIKNAKEHYENKEIHADLTAADINTHNVELAILDADRRLGIKDDPLIADSVIVKSVYPLTPVGDKLKLHISNYVVSVGYHVMSPAQPEKRSAVLVTKDGQYFTLKNFRKDGRL